MPAQQDAGRPGPTPVRSSLRPRRWSSGSLARAATRHARFVAVMKLVLPLSAAALIAVVVTWPYVASRDDAGLRLTFAKESTEADGQITMLNARYVGTDRESRPFTITAERATQDPVTADRVDLVTIDADITLADGTWLALSAERGRYDRATQSLVLLGQVALFSDAGYELRTEDVTIRLDERDAASDRPVTAQGPLGIIAAAGFRAEDGGDRVRFIGPIRMTLYPSAGG